MNRERACKYGGVTLVELLVAISITVSMLGITGLIFSRTTTASGKAKASNEIMQQLRVITRQLEQDFSGLRADMPMAIIFEEDDAFAGAVPIRHDRIVFFANGDFVVNEGTERDEANTARIFYGQSDDPLGKPGDFEEYPETPNRRILARDYRIITPDSFVRNFLISSMPSYLSAPVFHQYSYYPLDDSFPFGAKSFWESLAVSRFIGPVGYFRDDVVASLVRRHELLGEVLDIGIEGLQRQYLLADVTDFRIEVWFESFGRWSPTVSDWDLFDDGSWGNNSNIPVAPPFGLFWNVNDSPNLNGSIPIGTYTNAQWWSDVALQNKFKGWEIPNPWPKALRFTFTLYDKNRRHFPEGQTFNYVVKIPER
jgi:type II secretory pathway pseudopilin PulG